MLKTLDVKTKSITDAKKEFSQIIKEVNQTGDPTFVFNHNKPEAVILSNEVYEKLVKEHEELKEQLFYARLTERINQGPGELIPSNKVVTTDQEKNPFTALSDEELFD